MLNNLEQVLGDHATILQVPAKKRTSKFPQENQSNDLIKNSGDQIDSWLGLLAKGVPRYQVGAAVLDYCTENKSTRAFVFFSLEQKRIEALIEFLIEVSGIEVVYTANLELTPVGRINLVELCYGHTPWFSEPIKERMARERFIYSSRAFVILYTGWDKKYERVQELKADLRSTLPLLTFERRIHGTDAFEDTQIVVEAITNPNTLDLLNRVRVSRKDRIFTRVPDSLRGNPNVCVDGSSIMELYRLRKSRDLDFICIGSELRKSIESMGFDINNKHYEWLPIAADQVILDSHLHVRLFGIKFTSLGVRHLILGFGSVSEATPLSSKKLRDFYSISLFNKMGGEGGRVRVGLTGVLSTFFTQLRLLYEFLVMRIIPRLPPRLVKSLRRVRVIVRSL